MKTYGPIFVDLKHKQKEKKIKYFLSRLSRLCPSSPFFFSFDFILLFYFIILFLLLLLYYYYYYLIFIVHIALFESVFCPEKIYFFSVHFILNKLNPSHFLTSEIFVKISFLKSLTTYHPENRKIFQLSHNSTKLF